MKLFVGHAYRPRCLSYELKDFRGAVNQAIAQAEQAVAVKIDPVFEFEDAEFSPKNRLVDSLLTADVGITDVSDLNANVLYELGFLRARDVPVLVLKSSLSIARNFAWPFYVDPNEATIYEDLNQIRDAVAAWLQSNAARFQQSRAGR